MSEKLKPIIGGLNQVANKIRAYHASPHKFDRFDISKIGTGEGAQSFGHGLYFAENPEVASRYRRKFEADIERSPHTMQISLPKGANSRQARFIENALKSYGGDTDHAMKALRHSLNYHEDPTEDWIRDVQYSIDALKNKQVRVSWESPRSQAYMYEVDLNVPQDRLIDWDLPIPQQSLPVREALGVYSPNEQGLRSRLEEVEAAIARGMSNSPDDFDNFWRHMDTPELRDLGLELGEIKRKLSSIPIPKGHPLGDYLNPLDRSTSKVLSRERLESLTVPELVRPYSGPRSSERAAEALLKSGIPGVKYFDKGSRDAGTGTRNIVMFDDAPIEIVNRYADGGAVEGDGISVPPEIAQQILGQGFANGGPVDWESYAEQAQAATNPVALTVAPQPAPAAPAPEQAIESGMSRLAPQASTPGAEIGSPMSQPQQDAPRAIGTGLNTPGTLGSALGTLGGAGMIGGIGGSLIGASLANRDLERIGAPERIGPMQAALAGAAGPFAGLFGLERPQQAFNDIVTRSFMPDDYTQIIGRLEPQVGQDLPQDNTAPAPGFSSVVDPGERSGYGWE